MAYLTETTQSFGATVSAVFSTLVSSVATFLTDLTEAGARADILRELQGMDDATLKAKHGIERSEIVAYVFRDRLLP